MNVILGKHFTGEPQGYADTRTGEFWQVLPPVNSIIQQALIKSPPNKGEHARMLALSRKKLS
ncbi:MAG: hypothetical protein JSS14_22045 [Proteobacteria bacterium]|nr:hypothetical protein [Pseudomonadota bacterium]